MKKFLLSTLCFVSLATAQVAAREVTSTEAADIASRFGITTSQALRAKALTQPQLVYTEQANGQNLFYVFNRPGRGYIIVAADDNATSVLAYSDTQSFTTIDAIPNNMRTWLADYARQIKSVAGRSGMQAPRKEPRTAIAPLIKTQWNQNAPFSNLCVNGEDTYATGCVATTMAQIMYFHQWPVTGTGSEIHVWDGVEFPTAYSEHTYDWENMLPRYFDLEQLTEIEATDAQKAAVAQLCYDAAISVHMHFDKTNSASATTDVPLALINHFGYSKSIRLETREYYSDATWENMIYTQLSNNLPIIYAGSTKNQAGHTFIIDGADENGLFHINWGWGGMNDGYFALTAAESDNAEDILKPKSQGTGGAEDDDSGYYLSQMALMDIVADKEGTSSFQTRFLSTRQQSLMSVFQNAEGIASEATPVTEAISRPTTANQWLRVKGNFVNASLTDHTVKLGVQLKKKDADYARIFVQPQAGDGTLQFPSRGRVENIRIPYADLETLPDGEYIVTPLWYDVEKEQWYTFTDTDKETSEPCTLTLTNQHTLYVASPLTPATEEMNADNIQLTMQVGANSAFQGIATVVLFETGEGDMLYEHPSRYQQYKLSLDLQPGQMATLPIKMAYNVYNIQAAARVYFSEDPTQLGDLVYPHADDQAFFTITEPADPAKFKDYIDLQFKTLSTESKSLSFEVSLFSNKVQEKTFVIPYLALQSPTDNLYYLINDFAPIVKTQQLTIGENTIIMGPVDSKVTNSLQQINTFLSIIDTPYYDGNYSQLTQHAGLFFNVNPTAIHGVAADNKVAPNTPVFNLAGSRIGTAAELKNLPKGIYIVDGKKVTIK